MNRSDPLDGKIREALAEVVARAPVAPDFDDIGATEAPRSTRPVRPIAWAAAAAVAAVIAGVMVTGAAHTSVRTGMRPEDRRHDGAPANPCEERADHIAAGTNVLVFLQPASTGEQHDHVARLIEGAPDAEVVRFLDQDAAYDEFRDRFADSPQILESVTAEALPPRFELRVGGPSPTDAVADVLRAEPAVRQVLDADRARAEMIAQCFQRRAAADGEAEHATTTSLPGPTDQTPGDPPMPTGDQPSQSAQDAARDGVHPAIAALADAERSERLSSIKVSGGYWVLSRPPVDAVVQVGDPDGRYGIDRILLPEYGELLLLDEAGRIDKAYPMPGLVPSWIDVTGTHVYAGRIGDGGLPWSSIVRIDRRELRAQVIVFPVDGLQVDPAPGWDTAPADLPIERFVTVGPPGGATSWIGRVNVDLGRIDELFDAR